MILNIVSTTAGLILLMAVGFFCAKANLLDEGTQRKLTGLLLQVIQPVYLFISYQRAFDETLLRDFFLCMAMAAATFLLLVLIPRLFFRWGSRDREVGLVTCSFPNVGFFGIPLISGIYGEEGVFFLTTMITMYNVFVWTYGVVTMSGSHDSLRGTLKRLLSPCLVAIGLGLACFLTGVRLPEVIASPLKKLGDTTSPLAMLITGAVVARANFRRGVRDFLVYKISLLRTLLLPAAAALCLFWLPVDPRPIVIVVLSAGFPVGSIALMLSVQYDKNSVLAGECVALTSVLCCATVPLIYLLLNLLMGAV